MWYVVVVVAVVVEGLMEIVYDELVGNACNAPSSRV